MPTTLGEQTHNSIITNDSGKLRLQPPQKIRLTPLSFSVQPRSENTHFLQMPLCASLTHTLGTSTVGPIRGPPLVSKGRWDTPRRACSRSSSNMSRSLEISVSFTDAWRSISLNVSRGRWSTEDERMGRTVVWGDGDRHQGENILCIPQSQNETHSNNRFFHHRAHMSLMPSRVRVRVGVRAPPFSKRVVDFLRAFIGSLKRIGARIESRLCESQVNPQARGGSRSYLCAPPGCPP